MISDRPAYAARVSLAVVAGALLSGHAFEPTELFSYSTGPLVLRPNLLVAEQYNDNIFYLGPGAEIGDLITIVHPGIDLWLGKPTSDRFVTLTYGMDNEFYASRSSQNSEDHTVGLHATWKGSRLSSETSGQFQFSSSIYGGYNTFIQGGVGYSGTLSRSVYALNEQLGYPISEKTRIYATESYFALNFPKGVNLISQNTLNTTLGFSYQALPKTSFFGEGYYGQSATSPGIPQIPDAAHVDSYGGFLGARGSFTTKLSGSVKVGFDHSAFADGSASSGTPVVEASLSEAFSEKTSARLSYARRSILSLTYGAILLDADNVNLDLSQAIGSHQKFAVTVHGSYGLNGYPSGSGVVSHTDTYYGMSAQLSYRIRLWFTTSLAYQLERLTTSLGTYGYTVNRVTVGAKLGY